MLPFKTLLKLEAVYSANPFVEFVNVNRVGEPAAPGIRKSPSLGFALGTGGQSAGSGFGPVVEVRQTDVPPITVYNPAPDGLALTGVG